MTESSNEVTDGKPMDDTRARLAALQRNSGPPALAARILTAGIGASMVFGLIAAMGWSDKRATEAGTPVTVAPTSSIVAATSSDDVVTTLPAPVTAVLSTTAPTQPVVEVPVVAVPVVEVPVVAVPVVEVPVVEVPVVEVPVVEVPVVEVPVATPVPAIVSPVATSSTAPPVATTRQSD